MKKKSIEQRSNELKALEKKVRLDLEQSEEKLRKKTSRTLKIALVSGAISLIAYWAYKAFFNEPTPKKEKKKSKKSVTSRLSQLATSYLADYFSKVLGIENEIKERYNR